eukprot:6069874-Lingulodinium_polyedra.AAC.1
MASFDAYLVAKLDISWFFRFVDDAVFNDSLDDDIVQAAMNEWHPCIQWEPSGCCTAGDQTGIAYLD